ncbi:uncharacterized protein [Rutidosis leptorrhynchoides]|uniref:uncharacterized protein n=1 Tax=Rutidosis leptorrhynchoides TaxID=125765 RepID=UPI003A99F780
MVRCLLVDKSMPKFYWTEAVKWACHILNRYISRSLDDKVPEEMWSGMKPSVDHFKGFGCIAYVHVLAQLRTKLEDRSQKCVFLGVSLESKAYRLYNPIEQKIVVSRDVIFDEDSKWDWDAKEVDIGALIIEGECENIQVIEEEIPPIQDQIITDVQGQQETTPQNSASITDFSTNESAPENTNTTVVTEPNPVVESSTLSRKTPTWMIDYTTGQELSDEEILEDEVGYSMYNSLEDPTTYEEASKEVKWVMEMENEIDAINRNATWELTDAPAGIKSILNGSIRQS